MTYKIEKNDQLPPGNYVRLDNGGEIVMMSVMTDGPVFIFPEKNLFIPWQEIMEYAATAQADSPSKEKEKKETGPREIPDPTKKKKD